MGADCKSAGYPTLVRIQLGPKLLKQKKEVFFLLSFPTNPVKVTYASLAQGLEHRICNATVVGSNPTGGYCSEGKNGVATKRDMETRTLAMIA